MCDSQMFSFPELNLDFLEATPSRPSQSTAQPLNSVSLLGSTPKLHHFRRAAKQQKLAQRIAGTDALVQQVHKLENELTKLRTQLQELSKSAQGIHKLYEAEKEHRTEFQTENAQLREKCEKLDMELANKTLQYDQVLSQWEEFKGPTEYSKLAVHFLKLCQKLDDEHLMHWSDYLLVEELTNYCTKKNLRVPQPKSPKKRIRSTKREISVQCSILNQHAVGEKPEVVSAVELTKMEFHTQGTQCEIPSVRGQGTQCEMPSVRCQGTQYISTSTTRSTSTECTIKQRHVGTCFPEPETLPSVQDMLKELSTWEKIVPVTPIPPLPPILSPAVPLQQSAISLPDVSLPSASFSTALLNDVNYKTVGTCTFLCNVQRQIDYLPLQSIKHSTSRPPSRQMYAEPIKNEMSSLPLSTNTSNPSSTLLLNSLLQMSAAPAQLSATTFEELWQVFGHMLLGLLQHHNIGMAPNPINSHGAQLEVLPRQEMNNLMRSIYENVQHYNAAPSNFDTVSTPEPNKSPLQSQIECHASRKINTEPDKVFHNPDEYHLQCDGSSSEIDNSLIDSIPYIHLQQQTDFGASGGFQGSTAQADNQQISDLYPAPEKSYKKHLKIKRSRKRNSKKRHKISRDNNDYLQADANTEMVTETAVDFLGRLINTQMYKNENLLSCKSSTNKQSKNNTQMSQPVKSSITMKAVEFDSGKQMLAKSKCNKTKNNIVQDVENIKQLSLKPEQSEKSEIFNQLKTSKVKSNIVDEREKCNKSSAFFDILDSREKEEPIERVFEMEHYLFGSDSEWENAEAKIKRDASINKFHKELNRAIELSGTNHELSMDNKRLSEHVNNYNRSTPAETQTTAKIELPVVPTPLQSIQKEISYESDDLELVIDVEANLGNETVDKESNECFIIGTLSAPTEKSQTDSYQSDITDRDINSEQYADFLLTNAQANLSSETNTNGMVSNNLHQNSIELTDFMLSVPNTTNNLVNTPSAPPQAKRRGRKRKADMPVKPPQGPCKRSARLQAKQLLLQSSTKSVKLGKYTRKQRAKCDSKPASHSEMNETAEIANSNEVLGVPSGDRSTEAHFKENESLNTNKDSYESKTEMLMQAKNNPERSCSRTTTKTTESEHLSCATKLADKIECAFSPQNLFISKTNIEASEHNASTVSKFANAMLPSTLDSVLSDSPASPSPTDSHTESVELPIEIPLEIQISPNASKRNSVVDQIIECYTSDKYKPLYTKLSANQLKQYQALETQIKSYLEADGNHLNTEALAEELLGTNTNNKLIAKVIVSQVQEAPRPKADIACENFLSTAHQRISLLLVELIRIQPIFYGQFIAHIENTLFNYQISEKKSLEAVLNLTQLYLLAIANLLPHTQANPARLFIAKCLYYYRLQSIPMVYKVLCSYPTTLPHREERNYDRSDALITVIQHVLMCTAYDMESPDLCGKNLLSKLRFEYHFDPFKPDYFEVLKNLMDKLRAGKLTNIQFAFAIFCKRQHPAKVTADVLQAQMLPLANEYYPLVLQGNEHDERVAALLTCISAVVKPFPLVTDVSPYLTIFSRFLNAVQRRCVQEAAVEAILRLQRFGYVSCYKALLQFKPTYSMSYITRASLKTFIHRRPLCFWKVLRNQLHTGKT